MPRVVVEVEILGTAGGVAAARHLFGSGPVVLHNGDILTTPPVAELVARDRGGLCLAVSPRPAGEGSVGLDAADRVVRLRGRSFGKEVRGADYIGIAVLGARCLASLPDRGCLIQDWAIPELEAGRSIDSLLTTVAWSDLGRLEVRVGILAAVRWGYVSDAGSAQVLSHYDRIVAMLYKLTH
jgi:mannose-1-phosphate guanylyltransferase